MAFVLRRLEKSDDRTRFRSTNEALNRFFASYAGQNQFRHGISATYVCVEADDAIAAFMTLTATTIDGTELPGGGPKFPPYELPALKIARLATADGFEGRGYGSALLRHAARAALRMLGELGCVGILTDAKSESVSFYEKHDFVELGAELDSDEASTEEADTRRMFLAMRKVVEATRER